MKYKTLGQLKAAIDAGLVEGKMVIEETHCYFYDETSESVVYRGRGLASVLDVALDMLGVETD